MIDLLAQNLLAIVAYTYNCVVFWWVIDHKVCVVTERPLYYLPLCQDGRQHKTVVALHST